MAYYPLELVDAIKYLEELEVLGLQQESPD